MKRFKKQVYQKPLAEVKKIKVEAVLVSDA